MPKGFKGTPKERLLRKVNKSDMGCWIWVGGKTSDNYGSFYFKKPMKAHKVSYILHVGDVPEGLCVLHQCDNTLCINPDHLWLGTQLENIKDRDKKHRGRKWTRKLPSKKINHE